MSSVEDQVRAALHEIAEDARPAPLLQNLEAGRRSHQTLVSRPRLLIVGAVAAAVVIALVCGVVLRLDRQQAIEPVQQPPKILRLDDKATLSPGRTQLAVTLAADSANDNTPAYLLPAGQDAAVLLPGTEQVDGAWTQHLSLDGTSFVRQSWVAAAPHLEIVDLRTGAVDRLDGALAYCPTLSPDGTVVAAMAYKEDTAILIDRASGRQTRLGGEVTGCGYNSFGWSPDGDRLLVKSEAGTELRTRSGRVVREISGWTITNGSMSWSPDGADLLMYNARSGSFAVVQADGEGVSQLPAPVPGGKPLGWTGDRVVWLVGAVGAQRLVTTDVRGGDVQPWMRLDLGGRTVDNVTWSWALSGQADD